MVDTTDLKSVGRKAVLVRVRQRAPHQSKGYAGKKMMRVSKAIVISLGTLLYLSKSIQAEDSLWGNEIRFGILQHDVNLKLGHRFEKGQDLNGEILFASPPLLSA